LGGKIRQKQWRTNDTEKQEEEIVLGIPEQLFSERKNWNRREDSKPGLSWKLVFEATERKST